MTQTADSLPAPTAQNQGQNPPQTSQVQRIHLGYQIPVIFRELVRIRDYYSQFPFVRRCAVHFGNPSKDNDLEGILENLTAFVKERVCYVPDPVGFEWVTAPDVLLAEILQKGVAYGDCDCHVLLLNTLLASVGFPTAFVAVMLNPAGKEFDHVISGVQINGRWLDVDPCAKSVVQPFYENRFISK